MFQCKSIDEQYNIRHKLHEVHQAQSHVPPVDKTHGWDRLTVEPSIQQIKLYKKLNENVTDV